MGGRIDTRGTWTAIAVAACALLAAPAGAIASDIPAVASHDVSASPARVDSYWTAERMRQATPLEVPATGRVDPPAPTAKAAAIAPDQEIPATLDLTYPYRIHGRLFLRIGPDDASCSATVVTSFTRDLILTAGHCVVEPTLSGPVWATNVVFVPAYRDGAAPLGIYPATRLGAVGIWAFEGDISFDLGAVNLAPGASGLIQDALGSRGVAFNRNAKKYGGKVFELFGYPAKPEPDYNGERPILCNATFTGLESFTLALTVAPCNQQEGSSGGGWVLPGGIVNSITSHAGCPSTAGCTTISGTYFGDLEFKLWQGAAGGLPKGVKKRIKKCKGLSRKGKRLNCLTRAETFQPVIR